MILYLLLGLFVGLVLFFLIYFIFLKNPSSADKFSADFFNQFNQRFPELLNQANQSLVSMADQKLGSQKQNIEFLVAEIRKQLEDNTKKLETVEQSRIGSFSALAKSLDDYKQITKELSVTADGLKKVLSNNQLRGAFGEQVAEDLLKMAGFVSGTDYEKQLGADTGRPDFTIKMPDGTILNIDSKFPFSNLVKMSETDDPGQKEQFLKLFQQDVNTKIKEISSRDYIDPKQNTVDFVILFIPNEMIFSFIYERFPDLWQEALAKKVILSGPFSFTALLRLIRQSYDSFKLQKNMKGVLSQIQIFQQEFEKYNSEFEKIGDKIDSLSKQYDTVNTTRTRQLVRTMDKLKLDEPTPLLDTP